MLTLTLARLGFYSTPIWTSFLYYKVLYKFLQNQGVKIVSTLVCICTLDYHCSSICLAIDLVIGPCPGLLPSTSKFFLHELKA